MPKAHTLEAACRLTDIPNIGPAMAGDLRALGIERPADLCGKDPAALYLQLCRLTGRRQDPCVLDTFMAVVAFASHDDTRPWWAFTGQRKRGWNEIQPQLRRILRN